MNTFKHFLLKSILLSLLFFTTGTIHAQSIIGGQITNPIGEPVRNAPVRIDGDMTDYTTTDDLGNYQFTVNDGGNYVITPRGEARTLDGISTLDVVLISRHVDNIDLLDTPYKIIAADIDNNGLVENTDTSILYQLILGQTQSFPNNDSWRYITADFVFPDPLNPLPTAFPSILNVNNVQTDILDLNFIGMKVGDVNYSGTNYIDFEPCDIICGTVSGIIHYDLNENCTADAGEQTLEGWKVTIQDGSKVFHGTTNSFGEYTIPAFPGTYTMTVTKPNVLWSTCALPASFTIVESQTETIDIFAQAIQDCPLIDVELGTPFLRRCFDGFYAIQYCNEGTATAIDASVEVTFDSYLIITGSSVPWTTQNGNTYTFDLGDLEVNECGTIFVDLTISCEAELGQTFCSEAHAFPNENCVPANDWNGAELELTSNCDGEMVRFEVKNVGAAMSEAVNYIVIEDDMIMMLNNGELLLAADETEELFFPANGSTWRVEMNQAEDHPLSDRISAAIEGCGENADGTFSLGFVTLFPQFSTGPSMDIDCVQNIGSYDPNDKHAIPEGVDEAHFIEKNTNLEYRIRFQNTGTDTAFTVVIRDTLSEWLEPTSVRPGAASHAYDFKIYESNIVEFRFPNIMLPDSNVNEIASHGFVKFNIAQKLDNPLGTEIKNEAAIYFDFNDPVITNETYHTIGENFLDIVSNITEQPETIFNIKLYPNLINQSATLQLEGIEISNATFVLYDLQGRQLRTERFDGNTLEFYKGALLGGLYLFEIQSDGQRLSSGKLMIR